MDERERLQLAESATPLEPVDDHRPRMPEPLPVKLVAVEDVTVRVPAGLERQLDDFYVTMLGFEREPHESDLIYRADNVRLRMEQTEGPVQREGYRPIQIEIPSLAEAESRPPERELEYERQRGLVPGAESLSLRDPGGNYVELVETRVIF